QLYKIESNLQTASQHVKVSSAKATHLKSLNRFFLLPTFGGSKTKRREEAARRAEEERAEAEAEREREQAERAARSTRQARLREGPFAAGSAFSAPRSMSTPQGVERDETEEEIDANLDQISVGLARLKMMSQTMNTELEVQGQQLDRISDRTDRTGERLHVTTEKLNRILK
ncbi:hypothetical protein BDK51DRAFT_40098, partial [Blyttiomyces helicus]